MKKRLAIIGCGSSGLITLKYALEELHDWQVAAYEASSCVTGCWGRPSRGFVSTSTKYTTQFACYPLYDARVHRDLSTDAQHRYPDFFCDGQYGDYLEEFAAHFRLLPHIRLRTSVSSIERNQEGKWILRLSSAQDGLSSDVAGIGIGIAEETAEFDAVVVCTGLADSPRPIDSPIPILSQLDKLDSIRNQKIVVIGGGESAVDVARRLAEPGQNNQVLLSVRNGMRVSPRYHPIRGVPSDFLRNRLLVSFDAGLRNIIGQRFVEFRMRCERLLQKLFPANRQLQDRSLDETQKLRNRWSWLLTQSAKDSLFNMYHNKSDDFLEDVAQGRIKIVGGNSDPSYGKYFEFGSRQVLSIQPDLVVPAIGYRSKLHSLTLGKAELRDFYMGIRHMRLDGLFAVGMTRPIIGNIPSISEIQAYYLVGQLSGRLTPPVDMELRHRRNRTEMERRFASLDTSNVYPVEMFPYCDQLAREMGCYPSLAKLRSPLRYFRTMLSPATTMHYFLDRPMPSEGAPIHAPYLLTALLLLLKPLDYLVRWTRFLRLELAMLIRTPVGARESNRA